MGKGCYEQLVQTSSSPTAKNASYIFAGTVIRHFGSLAFFAFAARLLPTAADLGLYSATIMITGIFPIIFTLAIHRSNIKFIAEYLGKKQPEKAKGLWLRVSTTGLVLSILAAVIAIVTLPIGFELLGITGYSQILIPITSVYIFFFVYEPFLASALIAIGRFSKITIMYMIQSLLGYGAAVIFLLISPDIQGIILGITLGYGLSIVYSAWDIKRSFHGQAKFTPFGQVLRHSLPLMGSDLASYLSQHADRYLVLILLGQFALGLYSPLTLIVTAVALIVDPIRVALLPHFAEHRGAERIDIVKKSVKKSSKIISVIVSPLGFGIAALSDIVILIVAGIDYTAASGPLSLVAIVLAVTSTFVISISVLTTLDRTGIFFAISFSAILIDIILGFLLIEPLGIIGASIARSSYYIMFFTLSALYLHIRTDLRLDYLAITKSLLSAASMYVFVICIRTVLPEWYSLVLCIPLGALIYILILRTMNTLSEEDVNLLLSFIPYRSDKFQTLFRKLLCKHPQNQEQK